jgi:hypothetical protein
MKASEVIEKLNRLMREHGDLETVISDSDFSDFYEIIKISTNKSQFIIEI